MIKEYKHRDKDIDDIKLLEPEATYSYADYLRWTFEERVELIKGRLFRMSPAPKRAHQGISGQLYLAIGNYLKGKSCKVYSAPFDVRFPTHPEDPNSQIHTVVQPDICVICDLSKLDDAGCNGAPDLIVEVLSESTARKDLKDKFELYEENGVVEYWVVYPGEKIVEIFVLNKDGKYDPGIKYTVEDEVRAIVLAGLSVELSELFND